MRWVTPLGVRIHFETPLKSLACFRCSACEESSGLTDQDRKQNHSRKPYPKSFGKSLFKPRAGSRWSPMYKRARSGTRHARPPRQGRLGRFLSSFCPALFHRVRQPLPSSSGQTTALLWCGCLPNGGPLRFSFARRPARFHRHG